MRRSAALGLAAAAASALWVGATAAPAAAHVCPLPALVPVGRAATVDVGVTVEDAVVPDVEVTFPPALRLQRVDPAPGWKATRTGPTVRFRGGPIGRFKCQYFSFGITAPARGAFGVAVIQRAAGGTVVARSEPDPANATDRRFDQIVYAGERPPGNGGSGPSGALLGGVALVAAGAGLGAFAFWRNRRARAADDGDAPGGATDDELRARLAEFRERTPRPPPGG